MSKEQSLILVAHDIRSLHNVGSLFRTCDGAGVEKLYLTGHCGFPPRKEISKTALGAELSVPWEHHWTIEPVLGDLRAQGYSLVALEQSEQSRDYFDWLKQGPPAKIALILGNEVGGLEPALLAQLDAVIELPMLGAKKSLNVAVCGGIVLYGLIGCQRAKG